MTKNRVDRASCTLAAVTTLGALLPSFALSQTPADPTLRETVVVATRADQPLSDVLADVTILDREDIERRGIVSLSQLLSELPGVQMVENNRVYIRGAESRMTALYIDGVRVDAQDGVTNLGGGAPWDLLPLQEVERIEVLRGPASAIYGSDAMGGVIQIFTARGQQGVQGSASLGAGTQGTRRGTVSLRGGHASGLDYAVSVSRHRTNGHDTRPDLIHPPGREGFSQDAGSLSLGWRISGQHRVDFSALSSDTRSQYAPFWNAPNIDAHARLDTRSLGWTARWSDSYTMRLAATQATTDRQDSVPFDFATETRGLLLDNRWKVRGGELSLALEQRKDRYASFKDDPYAFPVVGPYAAEREQRGVAAGYGRAWGKHGLQLNLRSDDDELFGRHTTGGAAYAYQWTPAWKLTASAATAFRAPTVEQFYGPYGSRALEPETSRNFEVGAAYQQGATRYKAVAFNNHFSDLISSSMALNTCSAGMFCYYNVSEARVRGITVSASRRVAGFDLRGSLDLLDPKDEQTGRQLSLRPKQQAFAAASHMWGVWRLGAEVRASGERYLDSANTQVRPGYAVWSATGTRALARDWTMVLRVDNLADKTYQQDYLTMPGRSLFANLVWRPHR